MANSIDYASIFQQELDKAFVPASVTGWMQRNARLAKYAGGDEIKIPSLVMDGLADYDRNSGYAEGDVTLKYTTVTMGRDRGRGFSLDAMDVDESNFVATAAAVMGEFQRTQVAPEVDAYNLSTLYAKTPSGNRETYTPAASTVYGKLKDHIAAVQEIVGGHVRLRVHLTYAAKAMLEKSTEYVRAVNLLELSDGGLNTTVKALDTTLLIPTQNALMKTAFTFYKGLADTEGTDRKEGGFAPAADAKTIHWLIVPEDAPIAICKQDLVRTFTPLTYQKANAWHMDYRRYFELIVPENKTAGLYACVSA